MVTTEKLNFRLSLKDVIIIIVFVFGIAGNWTSSHLRIKQLEVEIKELKTDRVLLVESVMTKEVFEIWADNFNKQIENLDKKIDYIQVVLRDKNK